MKRLRDIFILTVAMFVSVTFVSAQDSIYMEPTDLISDDDKIDFTQSTYQRPSSYYEYQYWDSTMEQELDEEVAQYTGEEAVNTSYVYIYSPYYYNDWYFDPFYRGFRYMSWSFTWGFNPWWSWWGRYPYYRPAHRPSGSYPAFRPGTGNHPGINRPVHRPSGGRPTVGRPTQRPSGGRPEVNRPTQRPSGGRPEVNRPTQRPSEGNSSTQRPSGGGRPQINRVESTPSRVSSPTRGVGVTPSRSSAGGGVSTNSTPKSTGQSKR